MLFELAADDHDRVDPLEQPFQGDAVLLGRQADRVHELDLGLRVRARRSRRESLRRVSVAVV